MLEIHRTMNMAGMEHMQGVASVPIPAGQEIAFAPGGYHLMCMKPAASMKAGDSVPVTLIFADGSKVTAMFAVRGPVGN